MRVLPARCRISPGAGQGGRGGGDRTHEVVMPHLASRRLRGPWVFPARARGGGGAGRDAPGSFFSGFVNIWVKCIHLFIGGWRAKIRFQISSSGYRRLAPPPATPVPATGRSDLDVLLGFPSALTVLGRTAATGREGKGVRVPGLWGLVI